MEFAQLDMKIGPSCPPCTLRIINGWIKQENAVTRIKKCYLRRATKMFVEIVQFGID